MTKREQIKGINGLQYCEVTFTEGTVLNRKESKVRKDSYMPGPREMIEHIT